MTEMFETVNDKIGLEIPINKCEKSRIGEVDFNNLEFGKYVADHQFIADYKNGEWQSPRIEPFANLSLSPTILALHYGQTVFEGMKAFKTFDGKASLFRIEKHLERINRSLVRMCMPELPYNYFIDGLKTLVALDADWVPTVEDSSLYIRPFVFATEERFGVKVSEEYKFIIFSGPVGPYYPKPLRVKIEDRYIRAANGGTGFAKCGGNYGGAFYPTALARKEGFDQVMWTDGSKDLYIEESGTMNLMFVIDGVVVTPPLSDTILDGITRDTFINFAGDLGYKVEVRRIKAREIGELISSKRLTEAFGTGTAAVSAPIKSISILGEEFFLPDYTDDSFNRKAKKMLSEVRQGILPDTRNWTIVLD